MTRRFFTLLLSFALAPVSSGAGAETAAAAELHYSVSWLKIPLARARAKLSREDGAFSVRGESWTAGALAALVDYRGFAETTGEWNGAGFSPRSHRNGGAFRGRVREANVLWEGGDVESEAAPPPDLERVSPVPESALPGAVDPFSAALSAGARIGREGACGGTEKVWDGRRLGGLEFDSAGGGGGFVFGSFGRLAGGGDGLRIAYAKDWRVSAGPAPFAASSDAGLGCGGASGFVGAGSGGGA